MDLEQDPDFNIHESQIRYYRGEQMIEVASPDNTSFCWTTPYMRLSQIRSEKTDNQWSFDVSKSYHYITIIQMTLMVPNISIIDDEDERYQICFCRNLLNRYVRKCSLRISDGDMRTSSMNIGDIDTGFLECYRKYLVGSNRDKYESDIGNIPELIEWRREISSIPLSMILPFPCSLDDSCAIPTHMVRDKENIRIYCTFVENPQKLLRMRRRLPLEDGDNGVQRWIEVPVDSNILSIQGINTGQIRPWVPDINIMYLKMTSDEIAMRRSDQYCGPTETYSPLNVIKSGSNKLTINLNNIYPIKFVFGMFEHLDNISSNNFSDYSVFPRGFIDRITASYEQGSISILDIDGYSLESMVSHLLPNTILDNGFFFIPFCVHPSSRRGDRAIITSGNNVHINLTIKDGYDLKDYKISAYSVNYTHLISEYDRSSNIGLLNIRV